jgi:hypothetical protein
MHPFQSHRKKKEDCRDRLRDIPNEDITLLLHHYEVYGLILMLSEKRMWYEVEKNIG